MAQLVIVGDEAKRKIKKGVDTIASAVKTTLGPKGRLVAIHKSYGAPQITKDGVTVAKAIELKDQLENIGAQVIKSVASKANDEAGDGTTTATVLAQAIFNAANKYNEAGANVTEIERGLLLAVEHAKKYLIKNSVKISTSDLQQLTNVATVSANNDKEIGEKIAQVFQKVGAEGVITVEEGKTTTTEIDYVEGMQFDRGYVSPYFITDTDRQRAEVKSPAILVTDQKISTIKSIVPVIEGLVNSGKKDIVIIAEDVDGEALATLILNRIRGAINVLAVKAPGFGDRRKEMLGDIAVLTGATFITEELGRKLDSITIEDLGAASSVVSDKDNTIIVGGEGDRKAVEERIKAIKAQIENTTSDYDKEKLQERLAKLSGGVGVIRVGAATEVEAKELKDRIDDAKSATRAALEEGIVAGGGIAYIDIANDLAKLKLTGDRQLGVEILRKALREPAMTILSNAGVEDASKVVSESGNNKGYNALTDVFEKDMMAAGIIDPVKVVRTAIEAAVSAAGTLSAVSAAIIDAPEPKSTAGPDMDGMGGMGGMPGMGMM